MRKRTRMRELSLCTGGMLIAAIAAPKLANAQNVSGNLSTTGVNYGSSVPGTGALATQIVNTGFGDSSFTAVSNGTPDANGSELDAAYGTVSGGYLYLFLSGNIQNNSNLLNVFIDDGRTGGQSTLEAPDGAGSMQHMDGSVFSTGFKATYAFEINDSGGTVYMDQFNLLPGGTASFVGSISLSSGVGSSQNINSTGIKLAINNTNTAGVVGDGGTGTAAIAAKAQDVQTGIEIGIPTTLLGNPTGNILAMADINGSGNPSDNYLSNQFLPGLPVGTTDLGGGGTYSGTSSGVFNLSSLSNFWFTVPQTVVPNGIWLPTGSGNWQSSATTNWSNGYVPHLAGDSASFSSASANATVTLVGNQTVGSLSFNDSSSYTLVAGASGGLTLDNGGPSTTATVSDVNGNHTIDVPVTLNSNADFSVLANGSILTVSGNIGGAGALSASSLGANSRLDTVSDVVLSGANTYGGGTTVTKGTLQLGSNTALPTGTNLTLVSGDSPEGALDLNGFNATIGSLTANSGPNGSTQIINTSTVAATATLTYAGSNSNPSSYPGNINDSSGTGGNLTALTVASGSLTLTGDNTYAGITTVAIPATLVLSSTAGTSLPTGGNVANNGSLVVNDTINAGNISGSGTTTVNSAMSLTAINFSQAGGLVNNGTVTVSGTGTVGPISGTGTLDVTGALQLATSSGLSEMGSLSITGSGTFDVNNNHVIINYGSPANDPIASIQALLATGYASGAWNGTGGIISTAASNNSNAYGLGYADAADAGNPAGLASGTIEIKYTLLGDANLDGVVNGTDFGILAANFNKGVTGWDKGDFTYANIVNATDFGDLAKNFNKGASGASIGEPAYDDPAILAFAAANGLLADVPEPASIGLAVVAGVGLLARRRRT